MSYCIDEVYSHPGKLLQDHLLNVANNSKEIFENLNINHNSLYSNISFLIGLTHDFAKCTSFFQDHLFNDIHSTKAHHSFLSAMLCYFVIKDYLSNKKINTDLNLPLLGYLVVKNHHGQLKNIKKEHQYFKENMDDVDIQVEDIQNRKLDSLKQFYLNYNIDMDSFLKDIDGIKQNLKMDLLKFKKEDSLKNYLYLIEFFSVLIDSDKLDASYTTTYPRIEINEDMVDVYKNKNHFNKDGINKIREQAYIELNSKIREIDVNDKLYSITLPTGSGKTLTALSFATKLRNKIKDEKGFTPRIIYSLPFLSIIDQNELVIKGILKENNYNSSDIFFKHNSMSEIYYKTSADEELDIDNAEMLIESWYSEIIITTFYQLFYSIITNKNRSLKKLHNIENSILILDEVQSLPSKYWRLINILLKQIAEEYNLWIIFMTATQPAIFNKEEMVPLIENHEKYFKEFDRVNYHFDLKKQTIDEFKEFVLFVINSNEKNVMIVVNTIQNSLDIFDYISKNIDDVELYYLSTNILPFERKDRIEKIRKSKNRKIIVSTQLIEAGVDIDVDVIYRDFAPIDSIVQTAGRCNRNQEKEKGDVHIVSLVNENGRCYANMIYDSISRETTYELVKNLDIISEKDFNLIIGEYYRKISEKISNDKSKDILKLLSKLEISNITNEFRLIEENVEKQDVFIDINEESHEIWHRFNEIYDSELTKMEKKREFKKIKSLFRKYIISVDVKKLGTTVIENYVGYIDPSDVNFKYDSQKGFITTDNENAFII